MGKTQVTNGPEATTSIASFDVAVVGGGLAGWVAATAATEAGARTVLIERDARASGGGNSVISGGALHACLRDPRTPPAELIDAVMASTAGEASSAVVHAWAHNCARAIEWIERRGGDLMTNSHYPHRAKVFDPVKPTVPGLDGDDYGTARFIQTLAHAFQSNGGTILQPVRAFDLAATDDAGWRIATDDGPLDARSVVLADGGFQADAALLKHHIGTDRVKLRATANGGGDGLRMGIANGAATAEMRGFYGHLLHRDASTRDDLWPYPILDGLAAVGIIVDADGRRLVDEGISGVRSTNAVAWSAAPDRCWLIFDDAAWQAEGRIGDTPPNPYLPDRGVGPASAATIEALAAAVGLDPDAVRRSVTGLFGGSAGAQPARTGRLSLTAAPFHALPLIAGVSFTFGGLAIDGRAQLLDRKGEPIAGLFAAGGTAAGLHGGPDVGYAGGLLEAAVFGLIAGEQAGRRGAARS